jgi:amino acid adenylation domain-containing protein
MYGITETTVHATYRRITTADVEAPRGSCIGRPLPDLGIELLDAERRPVVDGQIGEIYVVGAGVARGYLRRPELTAERFVRLPESGQRAYRSGDLARALPDGDLVYLGRADQQVKIRGHRIELGEIQSRLLEIPGVSDAAVVHRREGDDAEIIAYVVPEVGQRLSTRLLRAELAGRVPSYMVPSAVVLLERLPLTVNGKLDQAALPPPRREQPAHHEPVSQTERALCRCIARAVGVEQVGLEDRFLWLGGHSLRAAQVARDLEAEIGLAIAVGTLLSDHTVAELAALLDRRPPALLEDVAPRPERRSHAGEAAASAVQLALWLHAQRYPKDAAYQETLTLVIPSPVDAALLEPCLADVALRHESLRTGFVWRSPEGALFRRVEPPGIASPVPLTVEDLRALPPSRRAIEAQRLAEAQARAPFDLASPPLLRALLVRLGEQDHRLYIAVHHAVCDAHSLHNLAVELSALYEARSRGEQPRLPPLPLSLAWPGAAAPESDAGEPLAASTRPSPVPIVPADLPRIADAPRDGARHPVRVPPSLAGSLRAACRARGATLFMGLLAAWHALLYRYSGSDETCVGTVSAQRARSDLAPLIGPLFAILPIAARPRGDQPFTALLTEVRAALLAGLDAGPRSLEPEPALSGQFETGLGMLPPPPRLAGGWQADLLQVGSGAAKHDLLLLFQDDGAGGLSGFIEYRSALYRADTVARLAEHFVRLLASIAAGPEQRLCELTMLTETERAELLSWSRDRTGDAAGAPPPAPAHELFLQQVKRAPEATAVEWEGGALSYRQLGARAAAIAARLRALGVGREILVAVCVDRSPDLIAALLGVLLAGGAFLPLDPALPAARLAELLAVARPALLLTRAELRDRVEGCAGALVCLDEEPLPEPPASETAPVQPHDLAYVIYTSGSTGQPKGVQIEHQSLSNLVAVVLRAFEFEPESRLLQLARVTFDIALMEILCSLAAGATLVLPSRADVLVGAELVRALRERAITIVALPASLLATLPAAPLPALRTLVVGGEACPPEVVDRWAGGRRFLNAYGPTEAAVGATVARCEPGQGKPPIGRPLANVEVYVLDADRELVPIGVQGELYIGGAGLARGYLNDPALTAARFVASPLRPASAERLYRTGDRVRWRADGQLDFLGRIDRQLKLRGFRVEPAEIEAALRRHAAVQDAVVALREGAPGHATLCAYVVLTEPGEAGPSASSPSDTEAHLRSFLRERLPDFMVPSAVVRLAALPLTPHGKVDLARLPPPPARRAQPPADASSRGTPEARIAAIWGEVLGIERVGHGDSFFDLGGTSLLLARAQVRLEAMFGLPIPMPILFQNPTPRALAEALHSGAEADPAPAAAERAERLHRALAARQRPGRQTPHE